MDFEYVKLRLPLRQSPANSVTLDNSTTCRNFRSTFPANKAYSSHHREPGGLSEEETAPGGTEAPVAAFTTVLVYCGSQEQVETPTAGIRGKHNWHSKYSTYLGESATIQNFSLHPTGFSLRDIRLPSAEDEEESLRH